MSRARLLGAVLSLVGVHTAVAQQHAVPASRPHDAARAEYQRRAGALANAVAGRDLAERRLELAQWCREQGLQGEMRREAEAVLQQEPAHAAAHRLLGHEQVLGKWLTHDEAQRARGLVQFRGQWLRPYDVAVLRYREEKEHERARLEGELNDCFRRLAGASATERAKALTQIEGRADGLGWPELAGLGRRQKAIYDAAWNEYELVATVRLQNTRVLALEPYTTSLGVGQPVTLQLPRVQSVSIGTTVVVPAGTGR